MASFFFTIVCELMTTIILVIRNVNDIRSCYVVYLAKRRMTKGINLAT